MELLHVSLMLSRWVEQLPTVWRELIQGSAWLVALFFVLILLWRVSHYTETLAHGQTRTVWLPPSQWLARWRLLREQGRGNAPQWVRELTWTFRRLSLWIGLFFMAVLGLFCIAIGIWALAMPMSALAILAGLFCFWYGYYLVKNEDPDPH